MPFFQWRAIIFVIYVVLTQREYNVVQCMRVLHEKTDDQPRHRQDMSGHITTLHIALGVETITIWVFYLIKRGTLDLEIIIGCLRIRPNINSKEHIIKLIKLNQFCRKYRQICSYIKE